MCARTGAPTLTLLTNGNVANHDVRAMERFVCASCVLLLMHALVSRLTATLSCPGYRLACQQTFSHSALLHPACVPRSPLLCLHRAPFCNMITTPVFMLVPLMSIGFGYHPVTISYQYVLAATLYFLLTFAIQFYVRSLRHLKASW